MKKMPGIDVKMGSYGDNRPSGHERYNSEDSLEDNQSTTSSTESRQSDFQRKDREFIPTRTSGILASKPASNPGQFTRVNSNPLLISAQKQMLLVEEVKKKKKEIQVGEEIPDWQSNLDVWKSRRRKQSEEALTRLSEARSIELNQQENGSGSRKLSLGKKISLQVDNDDRIDLDDLPGAADDQVDFDDLPGSADQPQQQGVPEPRHSSQPPSQKSSFSQVPGIPEEAEYEDNNSDKEESLKFSQKQASENFEKSYKTSEAGGSRESATRSPDLTDNFNNNPYQNAIESYKSFAKSHLSTSEEKKLAGMDGSEQRDNGVNLSKQSDDSFSVSKEEEKWEEKIESYIQPSRKMSTELSEKMRLKLASFEEAAVAASASNPSNREIQPDNTFREKLKVFKTFETTTNTTADQQQQQNGSRRESADPILRKPFVGAGLRRESEPAISSSMSGLKLSGTSASSINNSTATNNNSTSNMSGGAGNLGSRLKSTGALPAVNKFSGMGQSEKDPGSSVKSRSVSTSALVNTRQNNKFYQQNSMSSGGSSSLDGEGDDQQLLDDALEESFSVLEEKDTIAKPIFSADDFLPSTERLAPPAEKPPPLPTVPPPISDEEKNEDDELAKKEREILEALEREEREKQTNSQISDKHSSPEVQSVNVVTSASAQHLNKVAPGYHPPGKLTSHQQQRSQSTNSLANNSTYQHQTTFQQQSKGPGGYEKGEPGGGYSDEYQRGVGRSRSATTLEAGDDITSNTSSGRHSSSSIHNRGNISTSSMSSVETRNMSSSNISINTSNSNIIPGEAQIGRRKPEAANNKDYNKHWLIQEAEQRRIFEAKQKQHQTPTGPNQQFLPGHQLPHQRVQQHSQFNQTQLHPQQMESQHNHVGRDQRHVVSVSDNIYANVDPAANNYSRSNSDVGHHHQPPHHHHPGAPPPPPHHNIPHHNQDPTHLHHPHLPPSHHSGDIVGHHMPASHQNSNNSGSSMPQLPPRQEPPQPNNSNMAQQNQDRVLSVSGKKKCSHCRDELGRGAAMIIESLRLFYHIRCFKCCVCSVQLGNGEQGTDVRVRNNRLHCQNCYSNDEGLKFSKV